MPKHLILLISALFSAHSAASTPKPLPDSCHAVVPIHGLSNYHSLSHDLSTLQPASYNSRATNWFLLDLHAPFFHNTPSSELAPQSVQSITRNPQTQRVELRVNPRCGWSDGQPISSQDLAAGIRRAVFSDSPSPIPGRFLIKGSEALYQAKHSVDRLDIQVHDEHTLSFPSDHPLGLIRSITSQVHFSPVPTHVDPSERAFVTSGPFYPVAFEQDTVSLKKNPHFCDADSIALNTVEIKVRSVDLSAIDRAALAKGHYSLTQTEQSRNALVSLMALPSIQRAYHAHLLNNPMLYYLRIAAPTVEQVKLIASSIDPSVIAPALSKRYDDAVSRSLLPEAYFTPKVAYHHLNPAVHQRPKPALSSNTTVFDAQRLNLSHPLKVIQYTRGTPDAQRAGTAVQAMLQRLPIELTSHTIQDSAQFFARANNPSWQQADLAIIGWGAAHPDPQYFLDYLTRFAHPEHPNTPALQALLAKASQEDDIEKRHAKLKQVTKLLSQQHTVIPILERKRHVLINKQFTRAMRSPFPLAQELQPVTPCTSQL